MNTLHNPHDACRNSMIRQQANHLSNRCSNKLPVKEASQMLPVRLLFKTRQYQKWRIALAAVAAMLFLAHQNGYAQADSTAYYKKLALENKHYPKNNVEINLLSLALQNYNFSYERSLSRKITFVAGYRYMPLSAVGDISLVKTVVNKYLNDQDGLKDDLSNISTGNKTFTGEFRFYGGKHPGARGFYASLYGRYTNMQVNYNYSYATTAQKYVLPMQSSLKGFGGGLMFGSKFLIGRLVTFDWYIIGGHYGKVSGDGNAAVNLSTMSSADKNNLKSDLESKFTIQNKNYVTATVDNNGVKTNANGPFIGLRALGFNLGIAF